MPRRPGVVGYFPIKHWSRSEIHLVVKERLAGGSYSEIAAKLEGRSERAVRGRFERWRDEEAEYTGLTTTEGEKG